MATHKEYHVRDFGAKGNGTTSDATAIANAITACRPGSNRQGDFVAEIVVVDGGSGYTTDPTVSVSVGSSATFTVIRRDNRVIGVVVTAGGSGYTGASVVTFSGGGGSGASAYCLIGRGARLIFDPGIYYMPNGLSLAQLHNVRIEGNGATIKRDATDTNPGVWLQSTCRQVTVNDLGLIGEATDRNGTYGVGFLLQGDRLVLDRCRVSKWSNFGMQVYGDTSAESRYFAGPLLRNCIIEDTFADGIHYGHAMIGGQLLGNWITGTEEEDAIGIYNDFKHNLVSRGLSVVGNHIREARWRGILVAGIWDALIADNIIDMTASHGISGDDGSSSGSITLSLTNNSASATVTSGTPFVGAYIWGTGLSYPSIITAISGSTVTLSHVANSTSSQSFSMYQGARGVIVKGNLIRGIGAISKNTTSYTDRHGIFSTFWHGGHIGDNLVYQFTASSGYAIKVADSALIAVNNVSGIDQIVGTNTLSVGSNVYGLRALYDDAGALKYRGTNATVTTLGNA